MDFFMLSVSILGYLPRWIWFYYIETKYNYNKAIKTI
jgi:hypothetical protein